MQILGTIPPGINETTETLKFKVFVCMLTLCVYILVGSWILTSHQPLGVTKLNLLVRVSVQSPSENTADDR